MYKYLGYFYINFLHYIFSHKPDFICNIVKVIFMSSKAAKMCADKLNQTSKMGNIMSVYVDSGGMP